MGSESLFELAVVLGLLSGAAFARRFFASGWQRNSLSVVLVVLGMVVAFMLCFGLGSLVQGKQPQPQQHGRAIMSQEQPALVAAMPVQAQSTERSGSWSFERGKGALGEVARACFHEASNPSIERTSSSKLRLLPATAHVER
jgi:hypothetical protein